MIILWNFKRLVCGMRDYRVDCQHHPSRIGEIMLSTVPNTMYESLREFLATHHPRSKIGATIHQGVTHTRIEHPIGLTDTIHAWVAGCRSDQGSQGECDAYSMGYNQALYEASEEIADVTGCDLGTPDDTPIDRFAEIWQEGINLAKRIGETNGYRCGHEAGCRVGRREGYEFAYNDGRTVGYEEGHSDGCQDGYTAGYDDGYKDGYDHIHELDGTTRSVEFAVAHEKRYPADPLAPPTNVNNADWKDGYDAAQAEHGL